MSIYLVAVGATVLLLLLIYQYIVFPSFISPLSKIPNAHFTAPFLPTWMWWKRRTGFENRSVFAAHQENGPIVRLAPNELSVASLDGLRQIYVGGYAKHRWYMDEFANYGLPNLVSMQEHKPHAVQKRMISHVYSKSYLQNSQDLVTLSHVLLFDRLLPFFDSAAHDGTPVEVLEFFQAVNMDFMSAYLFGIANGTDFMRDVKARKHYIRMYQTKLLRLPGADVASKYLESHCLYMCNAAEKYIQTPEKNSSHVPMTNPVVYSQLSSQKAKIQDPSDPPNSNHLAVASEMLDHLLAGRETSAITLTYLMHELSRRPAIQSALRSELLTLSPPILYTNNTSSLPHPQTIDALPLLNAILQETLRRYAANPAPQPRLTPSGATIEGYTNIPAGVRISTAAYCLHRNAEVFPDPDAWKPERWLQGDQKKGGGTEEMRRWFWAFGSGGKMCIGSNFALQVMKLLVATVYTNYATTIVDDEGIEQADSYLAGPVGNKLVLKFHRVS